MIILIFQKSYFYVHHIENCIFGIFSLAYYYLRNDKYTNILCIKTFQARAICMITYRLVPQIMYQAMEKGMTPFLNYNICCRFAIKRFAIKIIRRSRIHSCRSLSFSSIHLSICKEEEKVGH